MKKPIYQIVEEDIKNKILSGEYKTKDMIPSENELKEKYNVSRMTIRQALNTLVSEGYLYKHKGKGTFVSDVKLEKNIVRVRGFTEEMANLGKVIRNKLLKFEFIPATKKIADNLLVDENDLIVYVERIRSSDDVPVLLEILYIPYNLFKDIEKEHFETSFYYYIETTKNYKISHCLHTIEARNADEKISEMLQINKNDSVLYVTSKTFLDNGRPFEYVKSYYRADQYRFVQKSFRI